MALDPRGYIGDIGNIGKMWQNNNNSSALHDVNDVRYDVGVVAMMSVMVSQNDVNTPPTSFPNTVDWFNTALTTLPIKH